MLLGLFASAVRLPASVCPVSSAPLGQACRMGCCANKCCCADSQKNHNLPSPPAAKDNSSNHEITAVVWATTTNFVTSSPSFDVSFGSSRVAQPIRHHGKNFSARFLSDPKSLKPEVCPLSEPDWHRPPALQFSSWISENSLSFYNFFTFNFGRDAGQTALVRRRHNGDAGKRRDRSHSHY